jgi:putative redox protein
MAMRVELHRVNDAAHFEARNEERNSVSIDGAEAIGGEGLGFRPMQLALTALASCASMDVGPILRKQQQELDDIRVTATGERGGGIPSPFTAVHLHFDLYGIISEPAARKALDLAVHSYCSVGATFSADIEITWSLAIHPSGDA